MSTQSMPSSGLLRTVEGMDGIDSTDPTFNPAL